MVRPNTIDDLWNNADQSGGQDACWPWLRFKTKTEGRFTLGGKPKSAHKLAYEAAFGTLPPKVNVTHSCGNRYCINPKHLIAGRRRDPSQDAKIVLARILGAAKRGDNGCLEFSGYKTRLDYGLTNFRNKTFAAHRLVWILTHGPIKDGRHVLHSCDNPSCINIEHLRLGTHADNMADRKKRGTYERVPVKLSPEQVREIKKSLDSTRALARKYGVVEYTIRCIRRGITWKTGIPYKRVCRL